jgi:starch-binding outer membrane protein, SusD/RagB family
MFKRKIYIVPLLALFMVSCVDETLDKSPTLSFSEGNAFQTFDIVQTYSMGFYGAFPGYDLAVTNEEFNGDLVMNNNAAQGSAWLWKNMTVPTSSTLWDFSAIRRINLMLKNIENSKMSEGEIKHWKSVGYFFRAYDYYFKIAAYGDVPWVGELLSDNDTEKLFGPRTPRAEVADHMLEELLYAEQNIMTPGTNGILANSIGKDAVRALISRFGLFEGTWRKYHGLQGGDKFLQASFDAGTKLIASYPALHPKYDEIFNSASLAGVPGIILYKQYELNALMHSQTSRLKNSAGNWDLTKSAADMYLVKDGQTRWTSPLFAGDKDPYSEFRNRDKRMLYTIVPPFRVKPVSTDKLAFELTGVKKDQEYIDYLNPLSDATHKELPSRNHAGYILRVSPHFRDFNEGDPYNVSRTGYFLFKYYNRLHDIQNQDFSDAPIFRMGEVLANYAEAAFELGKFNQDIADKTINKLRARGGVAPMLVSAITANFDPKRDTSVDPVLWEIRRERAVELMVEGFRFNDLRRWKKMDYAAKEKLGCWIVAADYGSKVKIQGNAKEGYCSYFGTPPAFPEHYYLYPVPSNQIILNSNIKQNPGW